MLMEALKGLYGMHKINIVHGDFSTRNIFLEGPSDSALNANVADFERTRPANYDISKWSSLPFAWYPAETIFDQRLTLETDLFSVGTLIWECMTLGASPASYLNFPHGGLNSQFPKYENYYTLRGL